MVTTVLPAVALIGVWQLRTAAPFRCTVQAPHNPSPQPYLVPVNSISSRRYHNNGISGSPSKSRLTLFTFSLIISVLPKLLRSRGHPGSARGSRAGDARRDLHFKVSPPPTPHAS